MDVSKGLEGVRGSDGRGIERVLVAREENSALLQHAMAHVQGKLLEDDHVEIAGAKILEPLAARARTAPGVGQEQTDVVVGRGLRLAASPAAEQDDGQNVGILSRTLHGARDRRGVEVVHRGMISTARKRVKKPSTRRFSSDGARALSVAEPS